MNLLLLTFSRVFGLIPLNRMHKNSNLLLDYSLAVCVPLCYLAAYVLTTSFGFALYHLPICGSICSLANRLLIHLGCFLYMTICFCTLYRRKKFYILFHGKLKEIDDTLKTCVHESSNDDNDEKPKRRVFYFTWMLPVIIITYVLIYDIISMIKFFKEFFFIASFTVTFPFFVACIVQCQFVHFVLIINHRFTDLKSLFSEINQQYDQHKLTRGIFDNSINKSDEKGKSRSSNRRKIGGKFAAKNDLFEDSKAKKSNDAFPHQRNSPEEILPTLFKLHDEILSLSCLTNSAFAPQCVVYLKIGFVIAIYSIVMNVKVIPVAGGKNPLVDYVLQTYLVWSLALMLIAYILLRSCSIANSFSKELVIIVHEILQKKPIYFISDSDLYYNKLKSFTLQFLQWEDYFQFNGIGLFTLDYTFIFSTLGAATSYLIVLLQFDMRAILMSEGLL